MTAIDSHPRIADYDTGPDPRRVFLKTALGAIAVAVALSTLSVACADCFGARTDLVQKALWIDFERNLPTLVNFALLALCSGLAAVIAWHQMAADAPFRLHWLVLSVVALLMAFDEAALVHEFIAIQLREGFDLTGHLTFAWILPYGAAVLALGAAYLRFLWNLPRATALYLLAGAAVYVTGAIGMEIFGGPHMEQGTMDSAAYRTLVTVEETLEMLGATVIALALIDLLYARQVDKRRYVFAR